MAHTSTKLNDFTHPIKANGSWSLPQKKTLLQTLRALFGKTVLPATGDTAFSATTVVAIAGETFRVKKGKTYSISGKVLLTSDATSGAKLGLSLAGSSGGTGLVTYKYFGASTVGAQAVSSNPLTSNSTGLAGAVECDIDGYFIPDVSGYITLMVGTLTGTTAGAVKVGTKVAVARVQG